MRKKHWGEFSKLERFVVLRGCLQSESSWSPSSLLQKDNRRAGALLFLQRFADREHNCNPLNVFFFLACFLCPIYLSGPAKRTPCACFDMKFSTTTWRWDQLVYDQLTICRLLKKRIRPSPKCKPNCHLMCPVLNLIVLTKVLASGHKLLLIQRHGLYLSLSSCVLQKSIVLGTEVFSLVHSKDPPTPDMISHQKSEHLPCPCICLVISAHHATRMNLLELHSLVIYHFYSAFPKSVSPKVELM